MNKHLKPGVAVALDGLSKADEREFMRRCVELGGIIASASNESGANYLAFSYMKKIFRIADDLEDIEIISINQALGRESEVEKNDWTNLGYAGEIPKVDQECEYIDSSMACFSRCKYIGVNSVGSKKFAVLFLPSVGEYVESKIGSELKFRPLKTEKEKFVERVLSEVEYVSKREAGILYDKGLRFTE